MPDSTSARRVPAYIRRRRFCLDDTEPSIASIPGVAEVVPGQMAYATLADKRVLIQGLAPGAVAPPSRAMNERVLAQVLAGDGVVVSRDIARALGIQAGDELTLPTPTGARTVPVLEVVPFFSLLGGVVSMSLTQLREWFDRPGSTILAANLAPGADRAAVETAIRERLPADVVVYTGDEAAKAVGASHGPGHGAHRHHGVDSRLRRERSSAEHADVVGAGATA